ncbi:reverse transcriptase domain-containing protein [Tanacetum coccineum]
MRSSAVLLKKLSSDKTAWKAFSPASARTYTPDLKIRALINTRTCNTADRFAVCPEAMSYQKRRVNHSFIHEVIKKEVIKLLDAGLIYPIFDSPWVSPAHCVPKKGGMTIVQNEDNELIPTKLVTGWRVCIDYRKLNDSTLKDHFPLPFMDQMLERLARNEYYCILDGFSRYFKIPIDPQDQEKTTFTCPYGTFAYRRMPFGLCNAPGMFQRCMMAIFHDMIEETMEVFMDDFSVFGDSFSSCISHLDKMLKRCKDTNLVLNWEKCHFMVKEGIVLGHKISKSGIEVDRAKIDVIAKLPHPTSVKGVRIFLGHAEFYHRFIKDFSKITRPMTHILEKETLFIFSKECIEAFNILKKKLTKAPILVAPDWDLPFEIMCDASDYAVGAVLGKQKTKLFQPIHSASKTMTDAQAHYTTTEKELVKRIENEAKMVRCTVAIRGGRYEVRGGSTRQYEVLFRWRLDQLDGDMWHWRVSVRGTVAVSTRLVFRSSIMELRDQAYENSLIYKEKTKKIHDSKIKNRVFNVGDRVLLFNSRLKIFSGKLKTRWTGPFTVSLGSKFFPYGTIELSQNDNQISRMHRILKALMLVVTDKTQMDKNEAKQTKSSMGMEMSRGEIKLEGILSYRTTRALLMGLLALDPRDPMIVWELIKNQGPRLEIGEHYLDRIILSQQDLDNLFGPTYEEYYAPRNSEVSDNSIANTFDNEDTPSSSSIIVHDNDALQIVTSSEETIAQESLTPVLDSHSNKQIQEDLAELDRNIIMHSFRNPEFEEAESSSNYQDPVFQSMHEVPPNNISYTD